MTEDELIEMSMISLCAKDAQKIVDLAAKFVSAKIMDTPKVKPDEIWNLIDGMYRYRQAAKELYIDERKNSAGNVQED